jgi:hypothetical protein
MPLAINNESMQAMRLGVSEINWRKVDEYRVKGLSWSAVSRVMDIPYNTLLAAKARRAEKET